MSGETKDYLYYGVLLFGIFTICLKSLEQFNKPFVAYRYPKYPALHNIEVSAFSSSSELVRGQVFYLLIIISIYIFIIFFWDTISKVSAAGELVVGPRSDQGDSGDLWRYSVPLAASSFLVASLSFENANAVEQMIRRLAHRLAGIPHSLFGSLTVLSHYPFAKSYGQAPSSRAKSITEAYLSNRECLSEVASVDDLKSLADFMRSISVILPPTIGEERDKIWSQINLSKFASNIDDCKKEVETLFDKMEAFLTQCEAAKKMSDGIDRKNQLHALGEQVKELCTHADSALRNLFACFTLLFVAQRNVQISPQFTVTRDLVRELRKGKIDPLWNAYIGSIAIGAPVAIALSAVAYFLFRIIFPLEGTKYVPADYWAIFADSSFDILILAGKMTVTYGAVVGAAVSVRNSMVERDQWTRDTIGPPFSRYLFNSITPVFIGIFATLTYSFFIYNIQFLRIDSYNAGFIKEYFEFYFFVDALKALCGLAFCLMFFRLSDSHSFKSRYRTITEALLIAVSVYMFMLFFIDIYLLKVGLLHSPRTIIVDLMASTIFTACFAFFIAKFVEDAEDPETGRFPEVIT